MAKVHKSKKLNQKFVPISDATFESLSREVTELSGEIARLRGENKNVILGAIFAVVLLVGAVAVEVILFNAQSKVDWYTFQHDYSTDLNQIKEDQYKTETDLKNKLDGLQLEVDTLKVIPTNLVAD